MARYAIGDIQGCYQALCRLLDQLGFDANRDELWLVGDLINRGDDSLATLRFLHSIKHCVRMVLGNHDLHLLALREGTRTRGNNRDLQRILDAPDSDELCDWLQQQPLVYRDKAGGHLMVHAALDASWSSEQALALSAEVESRLQSDHAGDFFAHMYGDLPDRWSDGLQTNDHWRCITNICTRTRCIDAEGRLMLNFKGELDDAPKGARAWFQLPEHQQRKETLLFGHWAALNGETGLANIIGLDTGCVWGNCLTAYNLDSGERIHCACPEQG